MRQLVVRESGHTVLTRARKPCTNLVLQGEIWPHSLSLVDDTVPPCPPFSGHLTSSSLSEKEAPLICVPFSKFTEINSLWIFFEAVGRKM